MSHLPTNCPTPHVCRFRGCGAHCERNRIEGSLATVVILAPVISIFPALALAAEHRATSALPGHFRPLHL